MLCILFKCTCGRVYEILHVFTKKQMFSTDHACKFIFVLFAKTFVYFFHLTADFFFLIYLNLVKMM